MFLSIMRARNYSFNVNITLNGNIKRETFIRISYYILDLL